MDKCPCQSELQYENCCQPYHKKEKHPPTAKELMQARYSAFATNNVQFIADTHVPGTTDFNLEEAREWATTSTWKGLEIVHTEAGEKEDQKGIVEFKAFYQDKAGADYVHHEKSSFTKIEDIWHYEDGDLVGSGPIKRESPKVGRNEPCPCGSGKKYKKCCGS